MCKHIDRLANTRLCAAATSLPHLCYSCAEATANSQTASVRVQLLGASIWTFKGKDIVATVTEAVSPRFPRAAPADLSPRPPWHTIWLPILMLYTPVHALSAAVSVTFVLLPAEYAAALWVGGLVIYYALTSVNAPEHTGKSWNSFPLTYPCSPAAGVFARNAGAHNADMTWSGMNPGTRVLVLCRLQGMAGISAVDHEHDRGLARGLVRQRGGGEGRRQCIRHRQQIYIRLPSTRVVSHRCVPLTGVMPCSSRPLFSFSPLASAQVSV